jgi:hypothetical protein
MKIKQFEVIPSRLFTLKLHDYLWTTVSDMERFQRDLFLSIEIFEVVIKIKVFVISMSWNIL